VAQSPPRPYAVSSLSVPFVGKESPMEPKENDALRDAVRDRYGEVARTGRGCCAPQASCCTPTPPLPLAVDSTRLGYTAADLAAVPDGANLGLGCGNPRAIAALRVGEVVVDLGCGAGLDCFLASRQVGPSGRVIGVDMTPDMVQRARANGRAGGITNVEIRLGEIEHLPVADGSADCILSNCVINLSPDKQQVFREAYRVLRPGGRLAISDTVATTPLPAPLARDLSLTTGCIAGAATVAEIEGWLAAAGFTAIAVAPIEASRAVIDSWLPGHDLGRYIASATIEAVRPAR